MSEAQPFSLESLSPEEKQAIITELAQLKPNRRSPAPENPPSQPKLSPEGPSFALRGPAYSPTEVPLR